MKIENIAELEKVAARMRLEAIDMTYRAKNTGAHIGGTLSMIEIMAVLYLNIMNYDIKNLNWENRDRFILSKGHGVMAQYIAMHEAGMISDEELMTFKTNDTSLYAHPSMDSVPGIEFSSGSLGQGLSLGVGVSLALKRKNNDKSRVFVLIGDGECDEGTIWEAAASGAHFSCNNLVAIIDENMLQYDGNTEEIQNKNSLAERWKSFGWNVICVDGHSVEALTKVFNTKSNKPLAVIARTVKGKGVSFMENNPLWHNGRLSDKQYNEAIAELEVG